MSVNSFDELISHQTHDINVTAYGPINGELLNAAIECNDCSEILIDFDRDPQPDERPQVYVSVSGGIAETEATRGDVDIVTVDWDVFNVDLPDEWETDDMREQLERLAEPARGEQLAIFAEHMRKITRWRRQRADAEKRREEEALKNARRLLREAGEL